MCANSELYKPGGKKYTQQGNWDRRKAGSRSKKVPSPVMSWQKKEFCVEEGNQRYFQSKLKRGARRDVKGWGLGVVLHGKSKLTWHKKQTPFFARCNEIGCPSSSLSLSLPLIGVIIVSLFQYAIETLPEHCEEAHLVLSLSIWCGGRRVYV